MARTSQGTVLTRRHYLAQLAVRASAGADVTRLWSTVDPTNLSRTLDPFARSATTLARARHSTSSGVAARYQEDFRKAEQVAGRAAIRLASPLSAEKALSTIRGAALSGIINDRKRGFSAQAAARNGLVKVLGATTRLVLGGGRDTIIESAIEDTRASRWQRVTGIDPCAFCAMLATRGADFLAEESASFEAHDHCSCSAEIAYEGSQMPLTSQRLLSQWKSSTEGLAGDDALNAFRRSLAGESEAA